MSDLLVTPQGVSRGAAAAAALASGFELAERVRPYVGPTVSGIKRAYTSLRDYSRVRYGPNERNYRKVRANQEERKKAREEVKKKLFEEKSTMSNAVMFQRSYTRMGRKRRRNAKALFDASIGAMHETIFRYQRASNSLLGPGETDIAYGSEVEGPNYVCPFHIMSLTNNILFPSNQDFGAQRNGMHRLTYDPSNHHFGYQRLAGQNNTGVFVGPELQYEQGVTRFLTNDIQSRVFHKWSEIRLNLYGSAYYPLTYEILILTGMPVEMSIFDYPPGNQPIPAKSNLCAFLREQVKDYIGNPIIGSSADEQDYKDKYRVLKRRVVKVDPLSYGDAAQQSTVGPSGIDASNVKNINIFLRHDRFREYSWTPNPLDQVLQPDLDGVGFDKVHITDQANQTCVCDVDREERVYLVIKCSAPRVLLSADYNTVPADAPTTLLSQTEIPPFTGSYDIVVRNCYRYDDGA